MTHVLSRHTSSLTSDHPRYFELFRPYFLLNLHNSANHYQNKSFPASNTNVLKRNQNVQVFSTTLTMISKESSFNVKPTKILGDFGGRGLPARSTFTHGCKNYYSSFQKLISLTSKWVYKDKLNKC